MKSFSKMLSCDGIPKFQVCCRCLNNLQCGHLTPGIIGISRIRSAGTCVLKILSGTAFDGRERGERGKDCVLQGQWLFRLCPLGMTAYQPKVRCPEDRVDHGKRCFKCAKMVSIKRTGGGNGTACESVTLRFAELLCWMIWRVQFVGLRNHQPLLLEW